MTIDWQQFTPFSSLIGGSIIGLGAAILVAFRGRIAGISGIVGALMQFSNTPKDHHLWRILFILGLLVSSWVYFLLAQLPSIIIDSNVPTLVIAGLLVGIGTRMGSGCTSGHGVCGLGRLSPRSLIATVSFMSAGFITCYLFLHWIQ